MRAIAAGVAALTVLALWAPWAHATGSASSCIVWCSQRHPVKAWEFQHHLARCSTAHCREKQAARTGPRDSRSGPRKPDGAYPCVYRWTYDGVRWWNLHYRFGGSSRNHLGTGSGSGYRTCAPWQ